MRNISAHYDLGNDFFALMLDETMMYSAAYYRQADDDLHTAPNSQARSHLPKLQLSADDHLLEIGTGWGGMALHAATHYGCRVTTTTISKEQHALTCERYVKLASMIASPSCSRTTN